MGHSRKGFRSEHDGAAAVTTAPVHHESCSCVPSGAQWLDRAGLLGLLAGALRLVVIFKFCMQEFSESGSWPGFGEQGFGRISTTVEPLWTDGVSTFVWPEHRAASCGSGSAARHAGRERERARHGSVLDQHGVGCATYPECTSSDEAPNARGASPNRSDPEPDASFTRYWCQDLRGHEVLWKPLLQVACDWVS